MEIWDKGVWEPNILNQFIDDLSKEPDALVLDIGANIGQYTLFAAKKGHRVLAVEPFYDNCLRIHKAAFIGSLQNNIVLITNALSNKRNEIKRLKANSFNIGAQSLLINDKKVLKKIKNDKYLVETILLDDIVDYLPIKRDQKNKKKAILKIDIEGLEPFAFEHANVLFDTIDIRVIYMEWGTMLFDTKRYNKIFKMVNFFYDRGFEAYKNRNIILERDEWANWPWDVIWRKN